jgi:prephenate dehydrogenase
MRTAEDLVRELGARPVVLDAETHDLVVARTSHLPHLVASALAAAAGGLPAEAARSLAATGFDGATRLAGSHPSMVAGFLSANAHQVRAALTDLRTELEEAERLLDQPARLAAWLERAGEARSEVAG